MSELQLSAQLVEQVQAVLKSHDEQASDPGVTSQYLCAIVGFLLGQQDMQGNQKAEVLDELAAFMKHVADDVDKQRTAAPAAPAAAPPPPPKQEAFGIWRPKT